MWTLYETNNDVTCIRDEVLFFIFSMFVSLPPFLFSFR